MRALPLLAAVAAVAATAGAAGGAQPRHASPNVPAAGWVTNGTVNAVADTGTTTYIGGSFSAVGPRTGPIVPLDAASGNVIATLPQVAGGENLVNAIAPDGSGGLYIGGDFTSVGGLPRHDLAHILSDGTVDPNFNPDPEDSSGCTEPDCGVKALAVGNGLVYVGGIFDSIGGSPPRCNIAAVNATTGLATNFNPCANAPVRALALSGDGQTLYIGGDFNSLSGHSRAYAGAVHTSDFGSDAGWSAGLTYVPFSTGVYSIVISGSTVYLGGQGIFTGIDVSGATDFTPTGSLDGRVSTIAVSGTHVYAGGHFLHADSQLQNGLAEWETDGTFDSSFRPKDFASPVDALAIVGSTLYIGGSFSFMGGQTRNNLAAVDLSGNLLSWDPNVDNEVFALAPSGSTIYVGGQFSSANMTNRGDIAAIDDSTGQATSWDPEANDPVDSLAVFGSTVYAGGSFSDIGDAVRPHLAALSASTGLATGWDPAPNDDVDAIAVGGGGTLVYVGGAFTSIGSTPLSIGHLAAVHTSDATAGGFNPGPNGPVDAIAVSGSTVYVGGSFTTFDGTPRSHLGAIQSNGVILPWAPNPDDTVQAIALSGSTVYVGGSFVDVGATSRHFLAAIDANGDPTSWNPGANNTVKALAVNGATVYAGGLFTSVAGQTRNYLTGIDATSGALTAFDPNPNSDVFAITVAGTRLDVGGMFTAFDFGANQGFASFGLQSTLSVVKTGTGSGTVSSAPDGIFCGATCSASFNPATPITLSALADPGSTFTGWSGGGCSGTSTCSITLSADTTVTATFTFPVPSISGFSPLKGNVGDTVTVNGSNLSGATSVKVGSSAATFTPVSAGKLTLVVPNGATGGHISVTTPGGTAVSSGNFQVAAPAPTVSAVSPGQGAPGTSISVKGFHFTGATTVTFGGAPAVFAVITDNLISATVPVGATTGKVAVTTAGGTALSPSSFTVLPAVPPVPAITSFSPGSGIAGVAVVIKGSGFTGATAVKFNGKAASYSVLNDTTIKAIVPAGATTGPIAVTTPGGSTASVASFTVL